MVREDTQRIEEDVSKETMTDSIMELHGISLETCFFGVKMVGWKCGEGKGNFN